MVKRGSLPFTKKIGEKKNQPFIIVKVDQSAMPYTFLVEDSLVIPFS
jgi:hypothetical protein